MLACLRACVLCVYEEGGLEIHTQHTHVHAHTRIIFFEDACGSMRVMCAMMCKDMPAGDVCG